MTHVKPGPGRPTAKAATQPHTQSATAGEPPADASALYTRAGHRKYINAAERRRLLAALPGLPLDDALFIEMLIWTGARLSEVLGIRACDVQTDMGLVVIRTLKRRRFMLREIPVPPHVIESLTSHLALAGLEERYLWPQCRTTAWRRVHAAMAAATIAGPQASPHGLRHGFAIAAVQAGVPITTVQKWLGHAQLSTTALYATLCGPEEMALARQVWKWAVVGATN